MMSRLLERHAEYMTHMLTRTIPAPLLERSPGLYKIEENAATGKYITLPCCSHPGIWLNCERDRVFDRLQFNQLNSKIITKKILLPHHVVNAQIAQAAGDRGCRQLSTIPVDNQCVLELENTRQAREYAACTRIGVKDGSMKYLLFFKWLDKCNGSH
ncbi:hypothetical protein ACLBOM_25050 [Escherichia coli]